MPRAGGSPPRLARRRGGWRRTRLVPTSSVAPFRSRFEVADEPAQLDQVILAEVRVLGEVGDEGRQRPAQGAGDEVADERAEQVGLGDARRVGVDALRLATGEVAFAD